MPLDISTVKNIAFLARLEVPDEKLEPLAGELSHIIGWVEQLAEVDTDGVPPMTSVAEMTLPQRPDVVDDGNYPQRVIANAPDPEGTFYAVPKVVE
jgi:aspartyl-tRNA(Asn)/glutamyl-tRNA(Gln) amidotransferase subunit C